MQFTPTTGKRNRNTLAVNSRDGKFLTISQTKSTYLTSRGRVWTTEAAVRAHYQAKTAVSASRHVEEIIDMKALFSDLGGLATQYAGIYTDQRLAIKYMYIGVLGAPPKESWHGMKLVPVICHMLGIPSNSHTTPTGFLTSKDAPSVCEPSPRSKHGMI